MGNLVTNVIKMSGDTADVRAAMVDMLGVTSTHDIDLSEPSHDSEKLSFTLGFAHPEPKTISYTHVDGQLENVGLAVLAIANGGTNYLREKQNKDVFQSAMPAEYSDTAESILEKLKLDGLEGQVLINRADEVMPGCILAGLKSIAAFKDTGHFNWMEWRAENWGTRADVTHGYLLVIDEGEIQVQFDTVNTVPVAWFQALAAKHPKVMMEGAGYDEDMDYAVHFVGDEPGELLIEETDDAEGVRRAQDTVHGPRMDDEPYFDGPM
jgi:hypothetical protein